LLKGVEAVIDKDKAGNILAQSVGANIFLILTDVDHAKINFGKEDESRVGKIRVEAAQALYDKGHFLKGSMGPKVQAAIRFVEAGGERAIITSLEKAADALKGEIGTIIVKE
jgi:carbamate kinase